MTGWVENIYQIFVAILFAAYSYVAFRSRLKVPHYRAWIKIGLFITGIIGFVFYLMLGTDIIDFQVMANARRLCMRGLLTVWLTLLICDELRITRT
jgi:hypothetical protein